MMKKSFFYILLCLIPLVAFGQINIKTEKGYIINNAHDTIYGEILLSPYSELSIKVEFIEANSQLKKQYTAHDLLGFHIDPDEDYVVITTHEKFKRQTVELKYFGLKVVQGEIEFIVVTLNSLKKWYYLNSDDFGLTKLAQEEKISRDYGSQGKRYKVTFNKYKITLGKYFYKYPVFQHRIDDTRYGYNPLSQLIYDYNAKFEKQSLIIKQDKSKWHITVLVGGDYNLIDQLIYKNHPNIYGMVFGLRNSFYASRSNFKVEFVIGLNYRSYFFKEATNQRLEQIEIPIYFEYNNKIKTLSPIARLGINPNLYKGNAEKFGFRKNKSDWSPGFNYLVELGAGINYKRFSIKYLINAFPLLMNTLEVDFRIK